MGNINDLPMEEKIELVISKFSGHEREAEIAAILSTLTSYKIKVEDCIEYYDELEPEEIRERINDAILNISKEDILQREEDAWVSIIHAFGIEIVLEIMTDWEKYVGRYIAIGNELEDMKKMLYENYFKEE